MNIKFYLYLFLISIFSSSCSYFFQLKSDIELTRIIEEQINENPQDINFNVIDNFDWDSIIILGPYSNIEAEQNSLNLDLSNITENPIQHSDFVNLIVFLKDNKSIKISELSRNNGDFSGTKTVINKANAKFIKQRCGKIDLKP